MIKLIEMENKSSLKTEMQMKIKKEHNGICRVLGSSKTTNSTLDKCEVPEYTNVTTEVADLN